MTIIKEDAPTSVTAGIEGPILKIQSVPKSIIRRAKNKKQVAEEFNVIADVLFCEEDNTAILIK